MSAVRQQELRLSQPNLWEEIQPGLSKYWRVHLCRLPKAHDIDATLEQALHNIIRGCIGVCACQDRAHGVLAPRRVRDACQNFKQGKQRLCLSCARRPLHMQTKALVLSQALHDIVLATHWTSGHPNDVCALPLPRGPYPGGRSDGPELMKLRENRGAVRQHA